MVILAMDTIDKVLAMSTLSSKYSVTIHAALSVSKKPLNHYYAKTNLSNTYWIAMGISLSILFHNYLMLSPFSPSSPSQAQLFKKCKVGGQLD